MKKILQIIPSFNKSWGGPRKMVEELSNHIINEKFGNVDILCTNVFGDYSKSKNEHINIYQFKTSIYNPIWIGHSNDFMKFINERIYEYDVLHIHEMWHYLHYYSIKLASKHKIPYIVTPHGGLEKRRLSSIKKKLFFRLIEKKICENAKYIHALTEFEENDILLSCPNATTRVIPNGINKAPQSEKINLVLNKFNINKSSKIILFLGRLHKDKGIDLLINSFKRIKEKSWVLIIAGPDEHNYEQKYRNQKNIIFTGLVEGNQKACLFEICDVFILPSFGEGFSISVLEAMSYKKPLIISNFCYFPDIKKHNAGLIIELSEESIISALNKILNNDELKSEMGNNSFRLVREKYDDKSIYNQIIDLYK